MSDFVQQQRSVCNFCSSDSWVILSPIELSIKLKIEAIGIPLKNWNVQINYGIKTGYNDAFIISEAKRNEIIANCKDEEERKRTDELIRPILRGRDIKRYSFEWASLYLIATFPAHHYDIDDYPAVRDYLLSFAENCLRDAGYNWVADDYLAEFCMQKLAQTGKFVEIDGKRITIGNTPEKARKKTNNKWFDTQDSISYWEDFSRPKIVWAELARTGNAFAADFSYHTVGNTGYILTVAEDDEELLYYMLGFLNSRVMLYCLNQITSRFDENGWRWLRQFVEQLRIPYSSERKVIANLSRNTNRQNQRANSEQINEEVAKIFGLSKEEREYIDEKLIGY